MEHMGNCFGFRMAVRAAVLIVLMIISFSSVDTATGPIGIFQCYSCQTTTDINNCLTDYVLCPKTSACYSLQVSQNGVTTYAKGCNSSCTNNYVLEDLKTVNVSCCHTDYCNNQGSGGSGLGGLVIFGIVMSFILAFVVLAVVVLTTGTCIRAICKRKRENDRRARDREQARDTRSRLPEEACATANLHGEPPPYVLECTASPSYPDAPPPYEEIEMGSAPGEAAIVSENRADVAEATRLVNNETNTAQSYGGTADTTVHPPNPNPPEAEVEGESPSLSHSTCVVVDPVTDITTPSSPPPKIHVASDSTDKDTNLNTNCLPSSDGENSKTDSDPSAPSEDAPSTGTGADGKINEGYIDGGGVEST